ncbi:EF-hand domain-containing protein [Caenispirillum salinarum]|uniref:EF-hand domain-containing protein n=1 Tax=Caenispirillum salinarum TaxID=859058 RepID=UPI00384F684C
MIRSLPIRLTLAAGATLLVAACAPPPGTTGTVADRPNVEGDPDVMVVDVDPAMERRFARLDANGDGLATWEEAYAMRADQFATMDADHNGAVTGDEFSARAQPFTAFDRNGDGVIEFGEFIDHHRTMFSRVDADGDGAVSLGEYARAMREMGAT